MLSGQLFDIIGIGGGPDRIWFFLGLLWRSLENFEKFYKVSKWTDFDVEDVF